VARAATDDVRVELPRFNAVIADNELLKNSLSDLKHQFEEQTSKRDFKTTQSATNEFTDNRKPP
jgi:hypothetical protein